MIYLMSTALHFRGIAALKRAGGVLMEALKAAEECWRLHKAYVAREMSEHPSVNPQEIFNGVYAVTTISEEDTVLPYVVGFQALEKAGSKRGMVEVYLPSRGFIDFTVNLADGTTFGWVNTGQSEWRFWVVPGEFTLADFQIALEAAGFKKEEEFYGNPDVENMGTDTHAHLARTACKTVPFGDDAVPRGRGRRVAEVREKYFQRRRRPQLATA